MNGTQVFFLAEAEKNFYKIEFNCNKLQIKKKKKYDWAINKFLKVYYSCNLVAFTNFMLKSFI